VADPNEITFKYVFEDSYNPSYANGVFGGISPSGEIVINFTHERHPIPIEIVHELDENGIIGGEIRRSPEDYNRIMIRYIVNGVAINLNTAQILKDWLEKQIQLLEPLIPKSDDRTKK
jgi:hypothetical protein